VDDPEQEHSARKPIGGPERRQFPAVLGVLVLIAVIVIVFAVITWVRYAT
jgi:hypothetical protein